jgi:hypothetical protein
MDNIQATNQRSRTFVAVQGTDSAVRVGCRSTITQSGGQSRPHRPPTCCVARHCNGAETFWKRATMLAYRLSARDMRHARSAEDTFAQAWYDCRRTQQAVTVWFWDAVTDPVEPGWVLRTYRFADGTVRWTDERPS